MEVFIYICVILYMLICQVREAARIGTQGLGDDGKALKAGKGKGKGRRRAKGNTGTLDQGVDKKRKGTGETPSDGSVKKNKSDEGEAPKEHPAGESKATPPCDPPNPPTKPRRNPKPKPSTDDIQEAWKEQELLKLGFRCCFVFLAILQI